MSQETWKQISIFVTGILFGLIIMGLISASILDNRMDNLQPSIAGFHLQLDILIEDLQAFDRAAQTTYELSGTTRKILENCIEIGRAELNAYARVFDKPLKY